MSKLDLNVWTPTKVAIPPLIRYKNPDGNASWESDEVVILLKDGTETMGWFNTTNKHGWQYWGSIYYKKGEVKAWKKIK